MADPSNNNTEISLEFSPYFRAYTDGRIERFFGTDVVPPCINSPTGVSSKDVLFKTGISARIFLSNTLKENQKLPLLVYFHGGAFLVGSPYCPTYHNYVTSLVDEANIVAVSVDYRLAPEYHVPIAYEDSWAALQWVASHCNDHGGDEPWLKSHVDFGQVFIAGDSAGGNIVHNMAARAGVEGLSGGMKLLGACLVQPHFVSKEVACNNSGGDDKKVGVDRTWLFACPTTSGSDDPRINPEMDSRLSDLGCKRVMVCLAEKDVLREGGWFYYETLKKSGWGGELEVVETEGEDHVVHLFNPSCERAVALLKSVATFINQK